MNFRKSTTKDVLEIMDLINQAKAYFKLNNIDQWQDGYPNEEVILNDIKNGYSYVLEENQKIIASAAISLEADETYNEIFQGKWLSLQPYGVIHRVVVDSSQKGKGVSSIILKETENICLAKGIHSIKVDTHMDNLAMQKLLKKNNFSYCGIIYLKSGSQRIAFEKLL